MTDDASPENLRKFLESDDLALVRMGISMAKGTESPEDYHQTLLQTLQRLLESHDEYITAGSDDANAATRRIGLAVVEASDIPEELYKNVFGLSLWDPEEENREAAGELVKEIGLENITEFPGWLEPFEDCEGFGFYFTLEASIVHEAAAEKLRKIGDTRALEPLITAFWGAGWGYTSDDWPDGTIEISARALGEIGNARAIEVLIEALGKSGSFANEYRVAAARALGTRAVEPLIALLEDEDEDVRNHVAETLRVIGGPRATEAPAKLHEDPKQPRFEALIKALVNVDEFITFDAVEPLISIGEPAVEPLIEAAYSLDFDGDGEGGAWGLLQIANVLGRIGDARAVEVLIEIMSDGYAREDAVNALVRIGKAAVEPLIEAFGHEYYGVRRGAAEALGRIGDARAVEPLIKALEDDEVRYAAEEALEKLGHEVE